MDSPANHPTVKPEPDDALQPDGAWQLAEATMQTWRVVDATLRPVLGQQGVAALVARAIYLARERHPWLEGLQEGLTSIQRPGVLHALLARQSRAEAAAGCITLYQAFHELLASLIGYSLTRRLLGAVSSAPSPTLLSGPPAQEHQP
jgi:hypothetical protein